MEFKRFSRDNGGWQALWVNWDAQCQDYLEDFSEFAPSSLSVLKALAEEPERPTAGVYGLTRGEEVLAACQLNVAFLPGYDGKVLRLRHLILSPRFDFAPDVNVEEYVEVLAKMFAGTVRLAQGDMAAKHVKLHFRSPADREFFKEFREHLSMIGAFSSVQMKGAWLYIS